MSNQCIEKQYLILNNYIKIKEIKEIHVEEMIHKNDILEKILINNKNFIKNYFDENNLPNLNYLSFFFEYKRHLKHKDKNFYLFIKNNIKFFIDKSNTKYLFNNKENCRIFNRYFREKKLNKRKLVEFNNTHLSEKNLFNYQSIIGLKTIENNQIKPLKNNNLKSFLENHFFLKNYYKKNKELIITNKLNFEIKEEMLNNKIIKENNKFIEKIIVQKNELFIMENNTIFYNLNGKRHYEVIFIKQNENINTKLIDTLYRIVKIKEEENKNELLNKEFNRLSNINKSLFKDIYKIKIKRKYVERNKEILSLEEENNKKISILENEKNEIILNNSKTIIQQMKNTLKIVIEKYITENKKDLLSMINQKENYFKPDLKWFVKYLLNKVTVSVNEFKLILDPIKELIYKLKNDESIINKKIQEEFHNQIISNKYVHSYKMFKDDNGCIYNINYRQNLKNNFYKNLRNKQQKTK